eukprot:5592977-Amphidinium_carterae.1
MRFCKNGHKNPCNGHNRQGVNEPGKSIARICDATLTSSSKLTSATLMVPEGGPHTHLLIPQAAVELVTL